MVDALQSAYQPGATFAGAFAKFLSSVFSEQGLIVIDAASAQCHALGADVLRQAILRADELHTALMERDQLLAASGYPSQVLVAPNSSLLFLIDERMARGCR